MRRAIAIFLITSVVSAFVLSGCDGGSDNRGSGTGGTDKLLLGGDTTVFDASSQAFKFPPRGFLMQD